MGTKVHSESFSRSLFSMRDPNDDSSSSSWHNFYGDKTAPFLQHSNGYRLVDGHQQDHERDALKQKMLEHEALFKNQVCELHRLYQIQRNMMEEVKRKDVHSFRPSIEPASSSCLQGHHQMVADPAKWNTSGFHLLNAVNGRASNLEAVNSPVSFSRGNNAHHENSSFLNGSTSKEESVALNGRPFKVRKTFDLQLPADDYIYIEEGESSRDITRPENVSKNFIIDHSVMKLDSAKHASASASASCLVDLNEPIQFEGASNFLDLTSENTESRGLIQPQSAKIATADSFHVNNGYFIHRGQCSNPYETGFMRSTPSDHQPDRSPYLHQGTVNPIRIPHGVHPSSYIKEEDRWKEGLRQDSFSRNIDRSRNGYLPTVAPNTPSFPFLSPFPNPRVPSVPSWVKSSNGFPHFNSAAGVVNPVMEPLPPQSQDLFSRKMFGNSSSRLNLPLPGESKSNGFYHGSVSVPKDSRLNMLQHPSGFDFPNCSRFNGVVSHRSSNHGMKGPSSCHQEMKSAMVIDLNKEVPRSPSDEVVILENVDAAVRKTEPEDHSSASLPWLKPKPTVKKIMGFSIFETQAQDNEPSSVASTSASGECNPSSSCRNKSRMIDINVACEPDEDMVITAEEPTLKKKLVKETACDRGYIDLNASVSDCEDHPAATSGRARRMLEIDLEAPYLLECGEEDNLQSEESEKKDDQVVENESLRNAAELIFEMSSSCLPNEDDTFHPCEASAESLLLLFATVVVATTSRNGTENLAIKNMDEFETMTLQLEETRKEDYMPKPIVVDAEYSGGNPSTSRPRRGQPRRGRQRRDFQRDILPGLASLSRHEVTEDLQIFGGLMRAMGHSWNAGVTRRNGAGRGRKRAVVEILPPPPPPPLVHQLNTVETGLEDRSLTGWGKTTRRPRRQRYPQGNPSSVMLS